MKSARSTAVASRRVARFSRSTGRSLRRSRASAAIQMLSAPSFGVAAALQSTIT